MTINYYQKHKGKLWKEALEVCQNLSEEEKYKRWKKVRERYQNFTEQEKEKKENLIRIFWGTKKKLTEYRRKYYLTHKK